MKYNSWHLFQPDSLEHDNWAIADVSLIEKTRLRSKVFSSVKFMVRFKSSFRTTNMIFLWFSPQCLFSPSYISSLVGLVGGMGGWW